MTPDLPEPPRAAPGPADGPRFCALLPAFNEEKTVRSLVERIRALGPDVAVIDDGSTDATADEARAGGAAVLRHPVNRGKGVALRTGLEWAHARGYEAAVTLDADGQHDPEEIPAFLDAYRRTGIPVLVGNRMWNPEGMPRIRRWTNRAMSALLNRRMGRGYLPDTQCGYRLIRCDLVPFASARAERFAAESEILLRMAERGVRVGSVRIASRYRGEPSSIRPLADTVRFLRMLLTWRCARKIR